MPQVLSVSGEAGTSSPEMELGQQFLVWKGEGGALGFGNTQYPAANDLSIFTYGRWYHVQMPKKEASEKRSSDSRQHGHWADMVLASLSKGSIGWRDKNGTYGFGNTQYPTKSHLSVFETDRWVEMPPRPLPKNGDIRPKQSDNAKPMQKKSTEQIASEMSRQWLVWKDKSGTYGFGDHQYPEDHVTSVFHGDRWIHYSKKTLAADTEPERQGHSDSTVPGSDLAARLGGRHLVWKDKNGTLGFGNLQYPKNDLASVYQADGWVEAETLLQAKENNPGGKQEPRKETASRGKSTILDGAYLVWKTAHGTLGFGNHQYPNSSGVSHIHVDGDWQPVAY
jgi:hypothetical protein